MSSEAYWLNDYDTLTLETQDQGPAATAVAGIKGITIEAEYQTLEHLYTADSVKKETSKQAQFMAPITIEYALFDGDFQEQWAGGAGASATSITDTSDPQEFKLTGNFRSESDGRQLDVVVEEITFSNIPVFDGSQDEYVVWGLEGEGGDITTLEETTTP